MLSCAASQKSQSDPGAVFGDLSTVAGDMQDSRKKQNGKGWTVKIKAAGPKQIKPGNWKDTETTGRWRLVGSLCDTRLITMRRL